MSDKDIEKAKRLLESKGYRVEKTCLIFEGLDESDVTPLHEFLETHDKDCEWRQSLEEALEEEGDDNTGLSGAQLVEYRVGDIIMPKNIYSPSSRKDTGAHRVMIIQSMKTGKDGIITYRGFLLSSQIDQSNKNDRYPNNIYISDYATILYRGAKVHKEAFIRVDDIVEFTNKDLDVTGVWKGTASTQFFRFVNNCYNNYKNGISNANRQWTGRRDYGRRDSEETA